MMATRTELERVAAMASALRPEWPTRSVLTLLERDHATRAYRDLAVAMAHIACDPQTQTPRRLSEAGPWWQTTRDGTQTAIPGPGDTRCTVYGHEHYRVPCKGCAADERAARFEAEMAAGLIDDPGITPEQAARNVAHAAQVRAALRTPDARQLAAGEGRNDDDE